MPETGGVEITAGTYIGNRLDGDPVWMMLVGPSSGSKGATLDSLLSAPFVHFASTLIEAALLSGTDRKKMARDSTGGLLKQVGQFGILVMKDFTSVFSQNRDAKSATLAALRECYDGYWSRNIGNEGGRRLSWKGKLGSIAACTEAIDQEHSTMAKLGLRYLYFRLPRDPDSQTSEEMQCRMVAAGSQKEKEMREELGTAMRQFLLSVDYETPVILAQEDVEFLVSLVPLAVHCRSHVERDTYRHEIIHVHQPEQPGRMMRALTQLSMGMQRAGVEQWRRYELVRKVALDCMPPIRRIVFDHLVAEDASIKEIAKTCPYSESTIRRAAEDLLHHGVLVGGGSGDGQWRIADRWRENCDFLGITGEQPSSPAQTPTPAMTFGTFRSA
jgi:hypothetical protein